MSPPPSLAGGSCRSPDPHTPPGSPVVGLPCPAAAAYSTRHTQPPPPANRGDRSLREKDKGCATVPLTLCPEPPQQPPPPPPPACAKTYTGTAGSPSHQRLGGLQGLAAVRAAMRPDNRTSGPSRAGEVRTHTPRDPPLVRAQTQPAPTPSPPSRVEVTIGASVGTHCVMMLLQWGAKTRTGPSTSSPRTPMPCSSPTRFDECGLRPRPQAMH